MSVSVRVTGKGGISQMAVPRAMAIWENEIAPVVKEAVRFNAPVRTGRLRDSVVMERRARKGGIEITFLSDTPYAGYVERGTPAHMIYPRRARMLHWVDPGGESVFRKEVHHPGTRANPFVDRAVMELYPWIRERLGAAVKDEMGKDAEKEFKA